QYLDYRHGKFYGDERGLGCLGVPWQYASASDGRGQARVAGLQSRDHGGRGTLALFPCNPFANRNAQPARGSTVATEHAIVAPPSKCWSSSNGACVRSAI